MGESRIKDRVDAWTLQVVVASRHLLSLYRALRDDKQAYRAMVAGQPSLERMDRLRLEIERNATWNQNLQDPDLDDMGREGQAWAFLVEGLAGLCAFYAMSDMADGNPTPELQKPRRDNLKSFRVALQGFRTSFPAELAEQEIRKAIEQMVVVSVATLAGDLFDAAATDPGLLEELRELVFEALWAETGE
jgi:hypothetical protein